MSFNLVDLVKEQITDAVLEKAGGLLGNDAGNLSSGITNAIPGLLGGLTGAANTPGKSGALFDAVNNTDDGLLNDFAGALGGENSGQVIEQGGNALSGILGSGMLGNLGSVLSSVTGMSRGGTNSLMGMLTPLILGVLKKKVLGGGLDAGGLTSLMNDQKANVASAMPSNLTSELGGLDGFPSFDGFDGAAGITSGVTDAASDAVGGVKNVATGATGAADSAASGVEAVGDAAQRTGGGIGKWLVPAIIALGLGWLAFTFLGKGDVEVPDVSGAAGDAATAVGDTATAAGDAATGAADAVSDTAGDATDAVAGAVDVEGLTGEFTGVFNQASETLGGITDVDSATAALPNLEELGGKVSGLSEMMDKVPEAARGPLQGVVGEGMGSLQPIIDKITAIPGVGSIIEPVLQPILDTLGGLAG